MDETLHHIEPSESAASELPTAKVVSIAPAQAPSLISVEDLSVEFRTRHWDCSRYSGE